jgi:hypothetical protein
MPYEYFSNLLAGNGGGAICVQFDGTTHEIEVKWKEIYFNAMTIHIWGDIPFRFNFKETLARRKGTQHALFKRLLTEVDGDRMLTMYLASAYSELGRLDEVKTNTKISQKPSISLIGPEFKLVNDEVQTRVMERMLDTYGTFLSFSDPILLQHDLKELSDNALTRLPA